MAVYETINMNCTNIETFIIKAQIKHGTKYNYKNAVYINNKTKINITCPLHGDFWQTPARHLEGREGCKKCATLEKKHKFTKPINEFIEQANKIHKNFYNYNKSDYLNNKTKICIICPLHGDFWQAPNHHLRGHGCPACSNCQRLDKENFIIRANAIHKNKYKYLFETIGSVNEKISIYCPEHGDFKQKAQNHLNGAGCPICSGCKKLTTKEFINQCFSVHGNKYDYSLAKYENNRKKIQILCREHGVFWQSPIHHKRGSGCPKCKSSKGERAIRNFLIQNNINFAEQKKFSDCIYKKELPFDFYLPFSNTIIEFYGEQHYASARMFGAKNKSATLKIIQKRDKIKIDWCKANSIKLIIISYKEIDQIEDILRISLYVQS